MRALVVTTAFALALCSSCPSSPPTSRAYKIGARAQLIGGPRALGEVGDWMIENNKVRFIVQDVGFSRGFGVFGGALLDADLVRETSGRGNSEGGVGKDNFGEMFPAFFLEALDPREVRDPNDPTKTLPPIEIENDGADGKAAVLIVRGSGGDFIALTENINEVLLGDDRGNPSLFFETRYILEPGANHLTMTTKVQNVKFPFGAVDLRASFGGAQIPTPFGDVMLFGAGNRVFAPTPAGFDIRFSLEDIYAANDIALPALPGIAAEFIASAGKDVSYGLLAVPPELPTQNFVQANASAYPGATEHSLQIPFIASAFTGVFQALPPPELTANDNQPGGTDEMSFTRHFIVGDGDVASISDSVYALLDEKVGSVSGRLRQGGSGEGVVGASIVVVGEDGAKVTQIKTDEGGRFQASLRPGTYTLVTVVDGYETQREEGVTVKTGANTLADLSLPQPAQLVVTVVERGAGRIPAKISLVGKTPFKNVGQRPQDWLFDLSVGEHFRYTDFVPDVAGDADTLNTLEQFQYTADGTALLTARPGTYIVVVGRGIEYTRTQQEVVLKAGETIALNVELEKAIDTGGYIGADFHLHSVFSLDSNAGLKDRITSYAAEGVEYAVSTDHNFIVDYRATIEKLGLSRFINTATGLELTTIDRGHFNGFPLDRGDGAIVVNSDDEIDTIASRTYGSFQWALRDPQDIFDDLRSRGRKDANGDVLPIILQVNHPRDSILGYFDQYGVNAETLEPEGQGGAIIGPDVNNHPEFRKEAFSFDFDAVEVFNGKRFEFLRTFTTPPGVTRDPATCCPLTQGQIFREYPPAQCEGGVPEEECNCAPVNCDGANAAACDAREAAQVAAGRCDDDGRDVGFPGVVDDWMHLLQTGRRVVGTANSDSHEPEKEEPGSPRSYVRVPSDAPAQVSPDDIVAGFKAGDVLMTNGPFVRVDIGGQGMGQVVKGTSQTLHIHVEQAPWVRADTLRIFKDGQVIRTVGFADTIDIDIDVEFDRDGFLVVEASSDREASSLFPSIYPNEIPPLQFTDVIGALGSSFGFGSIDGALAPKLTFVTTPYALTNPIFIDADGDGVITPTARIPGIDDVAGVPRVQRPTPTLTLGGTLRMVTVPTEIEAAEEREREMWEALPLKRKLALERLPRWLWPTNDPRDIRRVLVQFVRHAH